MTNKAKERLPENITLTEGVKTIKNNWRFISIDAAILDKVTFYNCFNVQFWISMTNKQKSDFQKTQLRQIKLKLTIITGDLFTIKFYIIRCSNSGQRDFLQLFLC